VDYLDVNLLALAAMMMVRGISISTRIAGFFFAFEMTILLLVSIITLIKFHGDINFKPFNPHNLTNGSVDCPPAFPWPFTSSLAGRTPRRWPKRRGTRKNVPKAVFTSIVIMLVAYVFFAYSTSWVSKTTLVP